MFWRVAPRKFGDFGLFRRLFPTHFEDTVMAHWNHGSLKSSKSSIGAESFWNTLIMAHWNHRFQDFSQNRKHWNHRGQNNTFTGSFDGLMYTNTVFEDDSASNFAKFRLEYHNSQRFLEIRTHNSVFRHECRLIHDATAHFFFANLLCTLRWCLPLNSIDFCNQRYSHAFGLKEFEKNTRRSRVEKIFGKMGSTGDSGLWKVFKTVKSWLTLIIEVLNFRVQNSEIIVDFSVPWL